MKPTAVRSMHIYEVRPRKDKRGLDLISDTLLFNDAVDDKAKLQQSRTV
jgi:hypothetical protein